MIGEDGERVGVGVDAAATLAVAAFSIAAALSFVRVFGSWGFLGDAVAVVAAGHGVSWALRRTRLPGWAASALVLVVVAWVATAVLHPDTLAAVLPTGRTWQAIQADWAMVQDQFADAVAPVPYAEGWSLLAIGGLAGAVFLGDTFAFRAQGRGEVLFPGGALFVFVAALGTEHLAIRLTLALIAAGVLTVAVLRARHAHPPRTALGPSRHPLVAAIPAAVAAALVLVLAGWSVGPRLPGAEAEPWVDTRHDSSGEGGGVTQIVSPLVDIRSRLVDLAATSLFTVRADHPANWRVSALPAFDGTTWGLPQRSLSGIGGRLADERPGSVENRQQYTVAALGGRLVPAAADPVRADGEGLRFSEDTSILVRVDRDLVAGDLVEVTSAMPTFTADQLRGATAASPPDAIYLALPDDFPPSVTDLAGQVVDGAPTPYDKARTLQDWFRTSFTYSLDVPPGHSLSAIEAFLERRTGYCEQFAGTFAAMARAIGLPARVAVGFTPGVATATGVFDVLGKNAHAWPEVWFDGYGWVAFEPTPGRGAPGAEAYTGVTPQQDGAPIPGPAEAAPPPPAGENPTPPSTTVNRPDDPDVPGGGTPDAVAPTTPTTRSSGWWRWGLVVMALVAAVGAFPAALRRLRRVQGSADAAERTVELWSRAKRAVEASTGERLNPTLTPLEQARQAAPRLPVAAQPLTALAEVATAATYAPPDEFARSGPERHDPGQSPERWCHEVEVAANDSLTTADRVRRYFTDLR